MTWQDLMQAVYVPLMFFSVWSTWVLWERVLLPAWRDSMLDRYVLGVGGTFISTALAVESLVYGMTRWAPSLTWLRDVYPITVIPKIMYVFGMILILGCEVPESKRRERIRFLLPVGLLLLAVGSVLAVLEG